MWYKRYGYRQPSVSGAEMGCLGVIGISLVSLIMSFGIAAFFKNGWLCFLTIPFSIIGFEACDRYANNEGFRFRERRKGRYIKSALKSIDAGATEDALESIRRAKIYGDIPDNLKKFELTKNFDENT